MLLSGVSVIVLLATLAQRELHHLDDTAPVEDFVKEKPAPISKGLHKMRGSSTSIDFRHLRSMSRSLVGAVEPPMPIAEHPDADPLAFPRGKGKAPTARWVFGGPHNMARYVILLELLPDTVDDAFRSSSTASLLENRQPYSEWV